MFAKIKKEFIINGSSQTSKLNLQLFDLVFFNKSLCFVTTEIQLLGFFEFRTLAPKLLYTDLNFFFLMKNVTMAMHGHERKKNMHDIQIQARYAGELYMPF